MSEALITVDALRATRVDPDTHLLLHCAPEDASALSERAGILLGGEMLRVTEGDGWSALHLAPDEWLLIGQAEGGQALIERFRKVEIAHSLIDVSERNLVISLSGSAATLVLNANCPLDLDLARFPVNACSRTLFGKVSVMLWRLADDIFRIEYARSFDEYVSRLLRAAAEDLPTLR